MEAFFIFPAYWLQEAVFVEKLITVRYPINSL
jgi:hypothetical protein